MYLNEGITDAAVTGFRKGFNAGMGFGKGFINGAYSGTKRHIKTWTDPRNRFIFPAKVAALATTPIVPFVSGGLSAGIGMRSGYRGEDYDKAIDKFNTGLDKRFESELNTMHRMKKPKSDLQRKWMNWNESSVLRNAYSIAAVIHEADENNVPYDKDVHISRDAIKDMNFEQIESKLDADMKSGKRADEITKNLYDKIKYDGMFAPRVWLLKCLKWLNKKAFQFKVKYQQNPDKPFWKKCLTIISDCIEWVTRHLHNLISNDKNKIDWSSHDDKFSAWGQKQPFHQENLAKMEKDRKEFEASVKEQLDKRRAVTNKALNDYDNAISRNDYDAANDALDRIATEVGGKGLTFKSAKEFEDYIINNKGKLVL